MRRWLLLAARLLAGAVALASGVWVLANTALYRQAEAWSTAQIVETTIGEGTYLQDGTATVFVGLHTGHGVGLHIDQLCSTSGVAGIMLVITGLLVGFARLRIHRALLGLVAMIGLVTFVNVARLTVLSWSVTKWGLTGWFEWLHLYGGAAISMLAIAVGCGLFIMLVRRSGSSGPAAA